MTPRLSVIVCAHNEAAFLPACLHSVLAQTRVPDELLVVKNASTDATGALAQQIPHVQVRDEPRKGLVIARETGRHVTTGEILVYLDADCRAPLSWLERIDRHFAKHASLVALSGPYRFYDWEWTGRALVRTYDFTVAPATQLLVKHVLRLGTIFYGGNFAVRRAVLDRIGGFGYLAELAAEGEPAQAKYGMLLIPGAEITQNRLSGRKNSHIVGLNLKQYISADQKTEDILREIRRQDGVSIACHPHHRPTRRLEISTCHLSDNRSALAPLVDVWEAANRDDLFSVTSLKHYPYVANSDFHQPKHLFSWKTLLRCDKSWPAIKHTLRLNVDVALMLFRNGSWGFGS